MDVLPALAGDGFVARPFKPDDAKALQRLLESCAEYFDLVRGVPPGKAEALDLTFEGPEAGADPAGKCLYGIWSEDGTQMIGVLDAFRDYPEPGVWYIGLLMFSPDVRAGGIGRKVVESLIAAAQPLGAREFQLNVVEQNAAAYRFWTALGFSEVRRWRQRYGVKESVFIRMRLQRGASA